MFTLRDFKFPNIDFSKLELPDFELPKLDLSKLDLSKLDLSKFDLADLDTTKVTEVVRGAAHAVVGVGAILVERARDLLDNAA
jgi:hypothetical protein